MKEVKRALGEARKRGRNDDETLKELFKKIKGEQDQDPGVACMLMSLGKTLLLLLFLEFTFFPLLFSRKQFEYCLSNI